MEYLKVNIPFFMWFPTFASKQYMKKVYTQPSLNVQTNLLKTWHFVTGSSVSSIHPPKEDIQIHLQGEPILATPFRKGQEGNDPVKLDDLKRVHQQANYINTILNTIAEQLNYVSVRIEENP